MALEHESLVARFGPSPRNAGRLEHWHYDTFRLTLGDGRGGPQYVGFVTGTDGAISRVALADGSMAFVREAPSSR